MRPHCRAQQRPLHAHAFYLDVRDAGASKRLHLRIAKLGGKIEVFLVKSVTHVVTDDPRCGSLLKTYHGSSVRKPSYVIDAPASPLPAKWNGGRRGAGYKSRTDAMLESVSYVPQSQTPTALQQAQLWNIPIWTLKKVENFLNDITTTVQKKINVGSRILKGTYIKLESLDRRNRAIFKEFSGWPELNLLKEEFGSPFVLLHPKQINSPNITKNQPKNTIPVPVKDEDCVILKNTTSNNILSQDHKLRMTRKARLRVKERVEIPQKQNGYCEICRMSYSVLSDHERTSTHINFTKNCSNFLSLDSLINEGIDVESFLKMNKSNIPSTCLERRSLRNIIKLHQDPESQNLPKELEVMCNGNSDSICKEMSPRESKKINLNEPFSSPLSNNGHYLRSKGSTIGENEKVSPKESKKDLLRNGSISPRIHADKNEVSSKINGRIDDKVKYGNLFKGRRPRSIRWRRPSPDCNPSPPDNQAYYKVVGMSTKLRSSNNYTTIHKDVEPVPPPSRHYNGESDTGLVVKFRRVRRSELSVLSDEAENFMFPKKDDSETTEDEIETSHYSNNGTSTDITSLNTTGLNCKIKEEVLSDDVSQDSCNSDCVRRKGRRRKNTDSSVKDNAQPETPESRLKPNNVAASSNEIQKTEQNHKSSDPPNVPEGSNPQPREKCLKWVDGKLKVPPEIENLTYTFEQVPNYEPWYDTFKRQDDGKENSKNIARYLGYYWKSPILPYEMGYLPPPKPNCCALSQIKKPIESKPGPARLYGTRGMKKNKTKSIETLHNLSRNPRKSPREHASTLAILGGLIHKKKNKHGYSDDSTSLPSVTEEDIPNKIPIFFKLQETPKSEETKKLDEFFSQIYDDTEDYDSVIENLDLNVDIEKSKTPNVIDLLQNYDQCESIENSVKEIQDSIQRRSENQRRRRGYKFKKKNKTGWPAKKRIQVKKEIVSLAESADSSRDTREGSVKDDRPSPVVLDTHMCADKSSQSMDVCVDKTKTQNVNTNYLVLENNENSITSLSDVDDKISDSSKCKLITDTDLSNSDDDVFSSKVDLKLKRCDSAECVLSELERTNNDEDKSHHSNPDSMEMQPVVRVQKIDSKSINQKGARKLRSAGSKRKLRGNLHR